MQIANNLSPILFGGESIVYRQSLAPVQLNKPPPPSAPCLIRFVCPCTISGTTDYPWYQSN